MSSPPSGPGSQHHPPGGYSPDCVDVFCDEPGDTTVQPCPPTLLESARAVREKLIRYGEITPPRPVTDTPGEAGPSASEGVAASPAAVPEADNGVIRVRLDASLLLRLHGLDRPIELIDEDGKVVALVTPLILGSLQAHQSARQEDESQPKG